VSWPIEEASGGSPGGCGGGRDGSKVKVTRAPLEPSGGRPPMGAGGNRDVRPNELALVAEDDSGKYSRSQAGGGGREGVLHPGGIVSS
jgi:hypothetical protein